MFSFPLSSLFFNDERDTVLYIVSKLLFLLFIFLHPTQNDSNTRHDSTYFCFSKSILNVSKCFLIQNWSYRHTHTQSKKRERRDDTSRRTCTSSRRSRRIPFLVDDEGKIETTTFDYVLLTPPLRNVSWAWSRVMMRTTMDVCPLTIYLF